MMVVPSWAFVCNDKIRYMSLGELVEFKVLKEVDDLIRGTVIDQYGDSRNIQRLNV